MKEVLQVAYLRHLQDFYLFESVKDGIIICCLANMQIFVYNFGSGIRKKMTPMREALEQIGSLTVA